MRKRIVLGVIAALVLGGAAVALADSSDRRVALTPKAESNSIEQRLGEVNRRLSRALAARVSCRSFGCVNRTLNRLTQAVNALNRQTFRCQRVVNVTRYAGYLYTPDGGATIFETTALDHTEQGHQPTNRVVVDVC
jgi:hypothetical protein